MIFSFENAYTPKRIQLLTNVRPNALRLGLKVDHLPGRENIDKVKVIGVAIWQTWNGISNYYLSPQSLNFICKTEITVLLPDRDTLRINDIKY